MTTIATLLEHLSKKPFYDECVQKIFDSMPCEMSEAIRNKDQKAMKAQISNTQRFVDENHVIKIFN